MSTEKPDVQAEPIPAEAVGGNRAALQNKQFRRLLLAWVFGNFADAALFITIAIWVKQMTGSDFYVSLIFVALGQPALIAPFLGMLADRFNRKYLMIINQVFTAAVALTLLTVRGPQDMWIIFAGVFLYAFGTGPLQGFAVTMVIGILTSVFTAVTVSRGIATLIYGGRRKIKSIAI